MASLINNFCNECKNTNVFCKGLCKSCYVKAYRKTEKGKEYLINYNLIRGKAATKRFTEKRKLDKPAKIPKENCLCGVISIAKGFCKACYQKERNKKIGIASNRRLYKAINHNVFKEVLSFVKLGITIQKACKLSNINCSSLYKGMTENQKNELSAYKAIGLVVENDDYYQ